MGYIARCFGRIELTDAESAKRFMNSLNNTRCDVFRHDTDVVVSGIINYNESSWEECLNQEKDSLLNGSFTFVGEDNVTWRFVASEKNWYKEIGYTVWKRVD